MLVQSTLSGLGAITRKALYPCLLLFALATLVVGQPVGRMPVVAAGATKAEVISAYGWPNGQSKAGTKEILTYVQGQVTLEDGRVTRVNFSDKIPWQTPRAAPAPAAPTSIRTAPVVPDEWRSSFEAATREAAQQKRNVLALFTGPAGTAANRFWDEVAVHPEFLDAFRGEFVFLRIELAPESEFSPGDVEQGARLRQRYEVSVFPTLLFLSETGEPLGRFEPTPLPAGGSARGRSIAAVRDAWLALGGAAQAGSTAQGEGTVVSRATGLPGASRGMTAWLSYAWRLIISGIGAGVALMLVLFWLVWRNWNVRQPASKPEIAARISDAASGLPTLAEIRKWPQEKVCAVVAGLAETEGYVITTFNVGEDADFELRRPGDLRACTLVVTAGAEDDAMPLARLRAFTGAMESRNVTEGWVVSTSGFIPAAAAYGKKSGLSLIDAQILLERLRDVPPVKVPGVLARSGNSRASRTS